MGVKNPWPLIRELAKIIRNDDTDALDYIDKEFSLEEISCEDCEEFGRAFLNYRKWLADFESLYLNDDEKCVPMEIPETEVIGREKFLEIPKEQIAFMEISTQGAMGTPGEVIIIMEDMISYSVNYAYGDTTADDICRAFPSLNDCIFSPADEERHTPKEWGVFYVGMGTFILYRSKYENDFKKRCDFYNNKHDMICGNWKEIAFDIIENQMNY